MSGEGLYSNSWVRVSPTGNLLYRHDEHGVRLLDFSGCGYRGGAVELPDVRRQIEQSRWITVMPSANGLDDATTIQNALNAAGQFPLNSNGFRGLVSLAPGDYKVGGTLIISNSGVVLKGSGRDQATGSRIWATNLIQHTLLEVRGPEYSRTLSEQRYPLAQTLVPAGTRTFKLYDASGLSVGQQVVITRPFTANWISAIHMDQLHTVFCLPANPSLCSTSGLNRDWKTDRELSFGRRITRIEGQWVTVDTPLPQTCELEYGGGFLRPVAGLSRIENVGIEDVFIGSYYHPTDAHGLPSTSDEQHAWRGIQVTATTDAWIRRVTGRFFGFSVVELTHDSGYVTVAECKSTSPISRIEGNRRYAFHMDKGEHNLIRDCGSKSSQEGTPWNLPVFAHACAASLFANLVNGRAGSRSSSNTVRMRQQHEVALGGTRRSHAPRSGESLRSLKDSPKASPQIAAYSPVGKRKSTCEHRMGQAEYWASSRANRTKTTADRRRRQRQQQKRYEDQSSSQTYTA